MILSLTRKRERERERERERDRFVVCTYTIAHVHVAYMSRVRVCTYSAMHVAARARIAPRLSSIHPSIHPSVYLVRILRAIRYVSLDLSYARAMPILQSLGITVSRYSRVCMRVGITDASIMDHRRFYPSKLRPSIIHRGRGSEAVGRKRRRKRKERRNRGEITERNGWIGESSEGTVGGGEWWWEREREEG